MSYIFSSTVSKNLTIDFIFAKNVLLRCAFLFKKRQMSFGKNRNLSNDLIYYYSSQSLPKISFINPDFFTQIIHSSQHQIVDNINNLETSNAGSINTTHQEFNCRRIPPQPQGRRSSRSPKASLRTSSLRPSYQPLEEFAKAGSSPTPKIIFGRLSSPKKLLQLEVKTQKIQDLLYLQFFWKN